MSGWYVELRVDHMEVYSSACLFLICKRSAPMNEGRSGDAPMAQVKAM